MVAPSQTTSDPEVDRPAPLCGYIDFSANSDTNGDTRPWFEGWIAGPFGSGPSALANAWVDAGPGILEAAYGDFALALYDRVRQRVFLARSALSSRPLFYRKDIVGVRFAALAQQLSENGSVDFDAIAQWYGALVGSSIGSMFEGVERVEPGTIVELNSQERVVRRFWHAGRVGLCRFTSMDDAASALREAMTAAVRNAVDQGEGVASLLSSGRDSSCVSALAAQYLRESGKSLHCYTASPGSGIPFASSEYLIDEAAGARRVAAAYPNIVHRVVTPRNVKFCREAEAFARVHSAPLGNPLSLHWWLAVQRQAVADGCGILLTGGMGNLTISDGGPQYLPDLLNAGRWGDWLRAAKEVASFEGASWLNVANLSVGGLLPKALYRLAQYLHSRRLPSPVAPYLGATLRHAVEREHERQDQRPPRRSKERGADLLAQMELGDVAPERMFGLSMLDPTADRRVVEVALSIPPEMLVSRYDRRPIFELAFGDLLPTETIRAKRRAYQSMDWNFAYDLGELHEGLARYRQHASIAEMLDVRAMEDGLARWPCGRLATLAETADLGEGLLRAFALGAFLHVHLPA